jgi:hypothetical protein
MFHTLFWRTVVRITLPTALSLLLMDTLLWLTAAQSPSMRPNP